MIRKLVFILTPILLLAAPNNPSDLQLQPSLDSVHVSWQDNSSDETGFKIYRGGILIASTPANETSYHDKFLAPHTNYHYTVKV